jgi:hypothetical protein
MTTMTMIATQTRRTDACRCRTEISVKSIYLVVALILPTPAVSAPLWEPSKSQVQVLHTEVDELSVGFKKIESAASSEEQRRLVSEHWLAMTQHLRSVQQNGCPECGPHLASPTAVPLESPDWNVPDIPVSVYQSTMRKHLGAMHDRMARLNHEKSPFERRRLLQQYWRRIYVSMDELRIWKEPVDAAVTRSSDGLARQDATLGGSVGLQFVKDDHTSLVANRGGGAAALALQL